MESLIVTVIVALLSGTGGAAITAFFIFKGKKLDNVYARLNVVEAKEEKCQDDLFEVKQELQGFYLITDILLQTCPQAEEEVARVKDRMLQRKRRREAEGG